MVESICILFLHILTTLFVDLLITAFWQMRDNTSLWYWFVFSWWWMMVSTFQCICWPSIMSSLEIFLFKSSAYFLIGFFFFWVVWVHYIFWVLCLIRYMNCKYFLTFSSCLLIWLMVSFGVHKLFKKIWCSLTCLILLLLLLL